MKKISMFLLAIGFALSLNAAFADCEKCKGKEKCADCKKEAKAKHKCNKECMKDGKCAEMKKK
jgi:hypothetical protein